MAGRKDNSSDKPDSGIKQWHILISVIALLIVLIFIVWPMISVLFNR